MTDLLEPVGVAASPAGSQEPPKRSRRRLVAIVVVVALVAIGAGLWALLPGALAIGQTGVLLDARPFTCKDKADVTTFTQDDPASSDESVYVPAIRLHAGLDCTMDVVVRNDSDVDVSVDRITIPLAGPADAIGIRADEGYMDGLRPSGGKDADDAVFDYEHDPRSGGAFGLAAHSVQRFSFHLTWSNGCIDDGGSALFTDAPTAVLSAGPWHIAKSWSGAGYAVVGSKGTASHC